MNTQSPSANSSGSYFGVGISLEIGENGSIRVKYIQCGSPAHFSGEIQHHDNIGEEFFFLVNQNHIPHRWL